jgi:hypothetical protein
MQIFYTVLEPAQSVALVTVYEAKLAIGILGNTHDDQLELFIDWASDEIAVLCNRVFARERVREEFRDIGPPAANSALIGISVPFIPQNRIYLTHWPVMSVESVSDGGLLTPDQYEIDSNYGIIRLRSGTWTEPSVVYTGGYDLPADAPMALRQAAQLLTKDAYYMALRGDQTIRMLGHKESRVMYFPPLGQTGTGAMAGAGRGSPSMGAVNNLISHFQRQYI